MKCCEIKEMICLYIDNTLDSNLLVEFEEHIHSCVSCKEDLNETKRALWFIGSVTQEELPPDFKAKLHSRLIEEKENLNNRNNDILIRNKYIKFFSSVAAILIICISLKGSLWNQFSATSNSKDTNISNLALAPSLSNADIKRSIGNLNGQADINSKNSFSDSKSDVIEQPKTDKPKVYADTASPTSGSSADLSSVAPTINGSENGTNAKSIVPKEKNDISIVFSEAMDQQSIRLIKNSEITIKVDNLDKETEKVKSKLKEYGAIIIDSYQIVATSHYTLKDATVPSIIDTNFEFIILNTELNKVLEALKASWGEASVIIKEANTIKVADKLIQLNNKLIELNNQTKTLESSKTDQDDTNLEKLNAQITAIQKQVDELGKNVDHTIVSITLQKK